MSQAMKLKHQAFTELHLTEGETLSAGLVRTVEACCRQLDACTMDITHVVKHSDTHYTLIMKPSFYEI